MVLRSLRERWEQGDKDAFKEAVDAMVSEADEAVETLPENVRWIIKELVCIGRAQIRPNKQGPHSKTSSKKEAEIAEAFKRWLSRCQAVNKKLGPSWWDKPEWHYASKKGQEVIIERLVQKLSLSEEDVQTIIRYLLSSSHRGKASPWEATRELVAALYRVGAGTAEEIYRRCYPS